MIKSKIGDKMELFSIFRDTIFLKEDSVLEKQISELKAIRDSVKDKNKIDKEIKLLEVGLQGEKEIAFELKNANLGMYVLHDITLKYEDLKTQIDYVIITKGYTYLVECKNLIGNITVDHKGEFQREYEVNGNKYKEAIYSPYTQAIRHQQILKKRWLSKSNKLMIAIQEKYFDTMWYKPLVVIANSKSLLDIKHAPKDIRNNIIRVDQLINYIKNDLENYDKNFKTNQKQMLELGNNLLAANTNEYTSLATKYDITETIEVLSLDEENGKNENLENKLREFRKDKSKKMNVPANYIFTDEEMQKIITCHPKSLEQLKMLNILPAVKINLHGQEIIDILNS